MSLYPIALNVSRERCLVVGGGAVASRKIADLLKCGALVHAVAPRWDAGIEALTEDERLVRHTRPFVPHDLEGARLVIAATDDPEVQEQVASEAARRGIPCNVVDVPHLCTFYVPAVLRRGSLVVSVTTEGKFPLLASALRDRIGATLPEEVGPSLDLLGEARSEFLSRSTATPPSSRSEALRRLLSGHALALVLGGRVAELASHLAAWKAGP